MQKEEKPARFLFLLMQRYAFRAVLPKRACLCHGLAKRKDAVGLRYTPAPGIQNKLYFSSFSAAPALHEK